MNNVRSMNIALRRFLHNNGNIATEKSPKSGQCSTLIARLQGLFIVHNTNDSNTHSRHLNSLEPCICTNSITNIPPDRDANPVPLCFEPRLDRMSHLGRPIILPAACITVFSAACISARLLGTCPYRLYTLAVTPERPCRNPVDALPVPARYPLHLTSPGRIPWGIPASTGRAPVRFSEKWGQVSSDSRAGARRDPPGLRQSICKTRFGHDHSARGPPGTLISAVFTARTGPGLIVT